MKTVLMVLLALASVILIVSVMFQQGESNGLAAIGGNSDSLFGGKKKSTGNDAKLSKVTVITAVLFLIVNLALVVIM